MNRFFCAKPLLAAAIALGALATASAAQARPDVVFSIGLNTPSYGYVQPAPVYVQPSYGYVQPQPIYYGNTYSYQQRRGAWGDADRDGVPNIYDRNNDRNHHGRAARAGWSDADRDGVANRYDRAPNNPYRR
jgi:hypothetical protein